MIEKSNNLDTKAILTDREQKCKADILEQIKISCSNSGTIYILCPAYLSKQLYQHFKNQQIESKLPRRAVHATDPDDELTLNVATTLEQAKYEVDAFVSSMVRAQQGKLS